MMKKVLLPITLILCIIALTSIIIVNWKDMKIQLKYLFESESVNAPTLEPKVESNEKTKTILESQPNLQNEQWRDEAIYASYLNRGEQWSKWKPCSVLVVQSLGLLAIYTDPPQLFLHGPGIVGRKGAEVLGFGNEHRVTWYSPDPNNFLRIREIISIDTLSTTVILINEPMERIAIGQRFILRKKHLLDFGKPRYE